MPVQWKNSIHNFQGCVVVTVLNGIEWPTVLTPKDFIAEEIERQCCQRQHNPLLFGPTSVPHSWVNMQNRWKVLTNLSTTFHSSPEGNPQNVGFCKLYLTQCAKKLAQFWQDCWQVFLGHSKSQYWGALGGLLCYCANKTVKCIKHGACPMR